MPYHSAKTYVHAGGLSCCFRQWRASSHCQFLHGYALKVEVIFGGELDEHGWVQDFGGLAQLKLFLQDTFDHKTLVAVDDPEAQQFQKLATLGMADVIFLPDGVGCEKFAKLIFDHATMLYETERVHITMVRVWEHEGNWASYEREYRGS